MLTKALVDVNKQNVSGLYDRKKLFIAVPWHDCKMLWLPVFHESSTRLYACLFWQLLAVHIDFFNLIKDTFFFPVCVLCNDSFLYASVTPPDAHHLFTRLSLMKLAPSFHLINICTKLVFSLLIQSHTHHWKKYQMMLDSWLYDGTCLNFWRILWCVFALLAVCYVGLTVTGAVWMNWCCNDVILGFWVLMAQQEGLHASMPGQCEQAAFLDPELPLGRICDNLEVKTQCSTCFLWGRMSSIAKAWNTDLTLSMLIFLHSWFFPLLPVPFVT